ncbi:MAG: hypothetical protein U0903_15150 [Planctomycetales bacterium]
MFCVEPPQDPLAKTSQTRLLDVAVTPEHSATLGDSHHLLIVPRPGTTSIKKLESLTRWLDKFGLYVLEGPADPSNLREEMQDWFSDPGRKLFTVHITGGLENAAWQVAMISYVARALWGRQAKELEAVHFLANIQGQPNFSKVLGG